MKSDLHKLLLSSDVAGAWEYPPGVDWKRAIAELQELMTEIQGVIGTDLYLDKNVQDASFFADIGVLEEKPESSGVIILNYKICFRFSWFSRLFTVFGTDVEAFDAGKVIVILEGHGFIYVPAESLDCPYDGLNEPYEPGLTWWTRYFDYL